MGDFFSTFFVLKNSAYTRVYTQDETFDAAEKILKNWNK